MEGRQTWAEALNINAEKLTEWTTQAPASMPVLVWCLENGHVSTPEYLAWACENFGLPVLAENFFSEAFDPNALTPEVRESWSPWFYPVAQWEDVTIVACVEPPSELPEGRYAFVLADPKVMRGAWGYEGGEEPKTLDVPQGLELSAQPSFVLNLDNMNLNLDGDVEGTDPNSHDSEDKTVVTLSTVNVEPLESAEVAPPTLPARKATTPPALKANPKPAPIGVSEETEIQGAFNLLRKEFKSALIMKCDEGLATPYKWDPSLMIISGENSTTVDLSKPSFFRIVVKTSQPYHGYVVDSPVHKEFFASLKLAEAPASVTALPLMIGNKLWGMLVAFGAESAQSPLALEYALKISEKLVTNCSTGWSQAA